MIQICICQANFIHICIIINMSYDFKNNRLAELRFEKRISQRQLAEEIGTSQANLSRWEKGLVEPSISECWKIADFFGVSIDYLCGRKDT